VILHTIRVELGERSYPIYLGSDNLNVLGAKCRQHNIHQRVVILVDKNSARAGLEKAVASLKRAGFNVSSVIMPAGERQKNLARAEAIHSALLKMQIPRKAAMIALGGGVVGDVAGFVASTYRRGLQFVQCPTTLLSQVDSSVGGKNGINHLPTKNAIGTYHQPTFVLSDVTLLSTLPPREIVAAFGEILKYPIVGDPTLLVYIEEHLDALRALDYSHIIELASRCLRIKVALVSEDEKEFLDDRGRVFLNVGHAVGHALEGLSRYKLRHGEAVLLGIIAEAHIAVDREGFPAEELDRLVQLYRRLKRRLSVREISNAAIATSVFKKGGGQFVLPRKLGEVRVVRDVSDHQLADGLKFIRRL
jgi:3-dehydroquinate synthase